MTLNQDLSDYHRHRIQSMGISALLGLTGVSLITLGCLMPKQYRSLLILPTLGLGLGATWASSITRDYDNKLDDHDRISSSRLQDQLFADLAPEKPRALLAPVETLEAVEVSEAAKPFRWEDIKDRPNDYAHVILAGSTGDGKTWVAERLAMMLGGLTIAVAPHWESGDYESASLIVGAGRYYGVSAEDYSLEEKFDSKGNLTSSKETGEEELLLQNILKGQKATCCQFINALLREMDDRYQLVDGKYRYRVENRPPINVVLDEYPAWSGLKGVSEKVGKLLREARKVGIRLIVLTQGLEAKALGIEGETSLKRQLASVTLRGFLGGWKGQRLDSSTVGVIQLSKLPEVDRDYLNALERPAIINGQVADTGDLRRYVPAKVAPVIVEEPKEPEEPQEILESPEWTLEQRDYHSATWEQWLEALRQGKSQSEILKNSGYAGKYYSKGKAMWALYAQEFKTVTE